MDTREDLDKLILDISDIMRKLQVVNENIANENETLTNYTNMRIKLLEREKKELKEKIAYLELDKEGIEQKDDILFKQNKDLKEKIVSLNKQILNYVYGKNAIDVQEKNDLIKKNEDLKKENDKLKESIENLEGKLILKGNLLSEQKEENVKLKELYSKEKLEKNKSLFNSYGEKYKIDSLKKELLDSKNGLNGANHVIKNNKEWIKSQDKKIKELEEKIRCLKSDKEDLQYNLRRKSTQKIQLETKNKFFEDKILRIYKTIEENYYQDGYYELLRIKNIILEILKES